jgi:hypothetical protein
MSTGHSSPLAAVLELKYRGLWWALVWIVISLLLIAAIPPEPHPKPWEYVTIGAVFGTFFGHAVLAGAWMALGPLRLVWRLPLSLLWLAGLVVALAINFRLYAPGNNVEMAVVFGGVALGLWILAQAPLWMLAMGYSLRLRFAAEGGADRSERQFGIRELMIVTFVVAVVLAFSRFVVAAVLPAAQFDAQPLIIISLLAVAGLIMLLPLLLAALLPRHAAAASLAVLLLAGLATAGELPLFTAIQGGGPPGGGPEPGHFYGINACQAAAVLAVAAIVRINGYQLSRR